jgi:hypothetical protein
MSSYFNPNSLNFGYSPMVNSGYGGAADFTDIAQSQASNFMGANPGAGVGGGGGFLDSLSNWWSGGKDASGMTTNGAGGTVLGIAQGLGNAYMGMQQFGLAKKALKQGKEQFDKNYAAQKQTTNASLEDRQRARIASNADAYESVGSYMNRNGIK